MRGKIALAILGLALGAITGFGLQSMPEPFHTNEAVSKHVIGFLPYWQLERANPNENKVITTLTYFALNVDGDGHIVTMANPREEDPGWYGLHSDKLAAMFANAKKNNVSLSLLISSGDPDAINQLVKKPTEHAKTLIKDITPIMKQYGFSDLNLDVEDSARASSSERKNFTQFVKVIKQQLHSANLGTFTLEISPTDVINYNLIDVASVAPTADFLVLMAYDYHATVSDVTGPVAPLDGAGIDSEYDVTTAVKKSLQNITPEKLILGIPLYGYEWETLNTAVRSAIIPGSGVLASNNRMEIALPGCATCSAFFDREAQETFVVYSDPATGTYHQIYFPNAQSTTAKITLANKNHLGGVALWALGYEGSSMLGPLSQYK